jgi:hypothetical protein
LGLFGCRECTFLETLQENINDFRMQSQRGADVKAYLGKLQQELVAKLDEVFGNVSSG